MIHGDETQAFAMDNVQETNKQQVLCTNTEQELQNTTAPSASDKDRIKEVSGQLAREALCQRRVQEATETALLRYNQEMTQAGAATVVALDQAHGQIQESVLAQFEETISDINDDLKAQSYVKVLKGTEQQFDELRMKCEKRITKQRREQLTSALRIAEAKAMEVYVKQMAWESEKDKMSPKSPGEEREGLYQMEYARASGLKKLKDAHEVACAVACQTLQEVKCEEVDLHIKEESRARLNKNLAASFSNMKTAHEARWLGSEDDKKDQATRAAEQAVETHRKDLAECMPHDPSLDTLNHLHRLSSKRVRAQFDLVTSELGEKFVAQFYIKIVKDTKKHFDDLCAQIVARTGGEPKIQQPRDEDLPSCSRTLTYEEPEGNEELEGEVETETSVMILEYDEDEEVKEVEATICLDTSGESDDIEFVKVVEVDEMDEVVEMDEVDEMDETDEVVEINEVDETSDAYRERREASELFRQLLEQPVHEVSLTELMQDLTAARQLALENYDRNTAELRQREVMQVNRDALIADLNTQHEAQVARLEEAERGSAAAMSHELRQTISYVVTEYEDTMVTRCAKAATLSHVNEQHDLALSQALDTFDLIVEGFLEGDLAKARNRVLSDLARSFETVKLFCFETILMKQTQLARGTFARFLGEKPPPEEIVEERGPEHTVGEEGDTSQEGNTPDAPEAAAGPLASELSCENLKHLHNEALSTALMQFDDATTGVTANDVESCRAALEQELRQRCFEMMEAALARETRQTVELYSHMMDGRPRPDPTIELRHSEALAEVLGNFLANTRGVLDAEQVENRRVALTQELNAKLAELKKYDSAAATKARAEQLSQELRQAVSDSLAVYDNRMHQDVHIFNLKLEEIEEEHTLAVSQALDTFDSLSGHLSSETTAPYRANLVQELEARHTNYKRLCSDMLLAKEARTAQQSFSERMETAVRDSDEWPRLQAEARALSLSAFDEATRQLSPDDVTLHRQKLIDAFDLSLNLVQALRNSVGEAGVCCVCSDRRPSVVFQPCRHLVCCEPCSQQLTNCAMCRAVIQHRMGVFQCQ